MAPDPERPDPLDDQTVIVASDASGDALPAATANADRVEALPFRDGAERSAVREPAFRQSDVGRPVVHPESSSALLGAQPAAARCIPDVVLSAA